MIPLENPHPTSVVFLMIKNKALKAKAIALLRWEAVTIIVPQCSTPRFWEDPNRQGLSRRI